MRVLIVESGTSRGSLATARSLAAAGHQVDVGRPPGHSLAARSAAVGDRVPLPPLEAGLDAFADAVEARLQRVAYDVVMGAGDAEVLALSATSSRLSSPVLHPPVGVLRAAIDKQVLHEAAQAEQVGSPSAATFTDAADLRDRLRHGPVVVKPRVHWEVGSADVPLRLEAQVATTEEEALRLVQHITDAQGEAVLQEFVTGELSSYAVLLDDEHQVVAHSQQRSLHAYPEPMGVSARAVTVPVDPQVADEARRLLRRLGLTGLVQIQYLFDPRRRQRHVIDVNPRVYGSIQLAIAAGADFPRLWLETAVGGRRTVGPPVAARAGVRYQWLEGDLRRSWARRSVPDALGSLAVAARSSHSILAPGDLGPARGHGRELARRLAARVGQA
jgi:predicted ATP-grasp superfamily ATP-dependent carboligase